MASLKISSFHVLFTNGRNISVISKGTGLQEIALKNSSGNVEESSQTEGDGGQRNAILACEFSPSGMYFAVCDDQKQLHVYETSPDWKIKSIRTLARRCIALAFTESDKDIVVADKAGDAYIYSTLTDEQNGQLILGHISMLTDVVMMSNDKFVATSDRDEKIRISCYPNAYNIHSYCLGHTEFISKLLYIKSRDLLLSGSGDGTIRLWNTNGEQLNCVECKGLKSSQEGSESLKQLDKGTVKCIAYSPLLHVVVTAVIGLNLLEIYKLHLGDEASLHRKESIELSVEPWDIQFDDSGVLWVLQPCKTCPILLYKVKELPNDAVQLKEANKDELGDWSHGIASANDNWKFFEDAVHVESVFANLWKGKIDNMPEYLEKKQKRLQQKQKSEGEPTEKKPKTDT